MSPSTPDYSNFFSLTSPSGVDTLTAQSSSMSDVGSYTVTLLITLDEFPSITLTQTFSLEIVDPCEVTIFDAYTVNNMQVYVDGSSDVQTLNVPIDSASRTNGDLSGVTFCGTRTLTIQSVSPSTPAYSNFLTLTSPSGTDTLTV